MPPTATRPTINQPLIAETNLCPKPVGQRAVSNPSADELSQTNPSLSPTAPGPNLSDNKLSKTCRTTSCPKPVGQQAVSNPSADKLSQTNPSLSPTAPGPINRLLIDTIDTPIKSFGTRQIRLQLGLQNSPTRSCLKTRPPRHDPVPLTVFKRSACLGGGM